MSANLGEQGSRSDLIKLIAAGVLVAIGIYGFYEFAEYSILLRVLGLLAVGVAAVAVIMQTQPGRKAWDFVVEAKTEVRKVVWPTRQETIQTTLVVLGMVVLMGLVLWLFDMLLLTAVRTLTGQGG